MSSLKPFFATWVLEPDASDHPAGDAPRSGTYTLLPHPEGIAAQVEWVDATGEARRVAFTQTPEALLATHFLDADTLLVEQEQGGVVSRSRYRRGRVKQVLVYRRDLNMRKGKIAAQCAHGSLAVFLRGRGGDPTRLETPLWGPMATWIAGRFTKVVLAVDSEADLLRAYEEATKRDLPTALITDSGQTEFRGIPTRTVVAIGPALAEHIDEITGPGGLVSTRLA